MMKRMAMSLLAVGLISMLVTAASFALFTASSTNANNVFTAGTVTLGGIADCPVTVNNIAPGDSGDFTCTVQYTGSLEAYVGYKATLAGDLFSCDGGGRFAATVGGNPINTGANPATLSSSASAGDMVSVTVDWALALAAGNDCQGDGADIGIAFYAVQKRNNDAGANPVSWN